MLQGCCRVSRVKTRVRPIGQTTKVCDYGPKAVHLNWWASLGKGCCMCSTERQQNKPGVFIGSPPLLRGQATERPGCSLLFALQGSPCTSDFGLAALWVDSVASEEVPQVPWFLLPLLCGRVAFGRSKGPSRPSLIKPKEIAALVFWLRSLFVQGLIFWRL